MTKLGCPLCAKPIDGDIIMNTRLTKSMAEKVEELDGQVIGISNEPCDECKDLMSKGFLLIAIDPEKTDDLSNPWRTGRQWFIKNEAAERMFGDISKGAGFIPEDIAKEMGFPFEDIGQ